MSTIKLFSTLFPEFIIVWLMVLGLSGCASGTPAEPVKVTVPPATFTAIASMLTAASTAAPPTATPVNLPAAPVPATAVPPTAVTTQRAPSPSPVPPSPPPSLPPSPTPLPTLLPSVTPAPAQPPLPAPTETPASLPDFANAGPLSLTRVGRVGQPMEQFTAYDNFVYVAAGMELLTVDFSDPAKPRQTASLSLPGLQVLQMETDGRTLLIETNPYTTVDFSPFVILLLDVSAPDAPQLAGKIELENVHPGSFAANGYYFALTGYGHYFPAQLRVFDISDPYAAHLAAEYQMSDLFGEELAPETRLSFENGTVYLSAGDQTWTLDAANPAAPPQTAAAPPPAAPPPEPPPYQLLPDTLRRLDRTDPANPVVTGEFTRPVFAAYDLTAVADFLYVVSDGNELLVLDISDPAAPQIAQTMPTAVQRLFTLGPWLGGLEQLPGAAARLRIWDTAAAPDLVPVSETELPLTEGAIQDVALANGRLHVATTAGLTVIDLTNLRAPQTSARWNAPGAVNGLTAVDDTVYLAMDDGLRILDVSDPAAPQEMGSLSLFINTYDCDPAAEPAPDPLWLTDVLRVGNYVYAPSMLGCMAVVDVTDPARPELAAMAPLFYTHYTNMDLWQNRLIGFVEYVSLDNLQTISLFGWNADQDTITPMPAGEITLTETDVYPPYYATHGAYIYAAGGPSGLIIIKATVD